MTSTQNQMNSQNVSGLSDAQAEYIIMMLTDPSVVHNLPFIMQVRRSTLKRLERPLTL